MAIPSPAVHTAPIFIEIASDPAIALDGSNAYRRHGPNDPGNAANEYAQAADPDNADLNCMATTWTGTGDGDVAATLNALEYQFETTPFDQRPDDFVAAFELRGTHTANFLAGALGGNAYTIFMQWRVNTGSVVNLDFRNLSHAGSASYRGQMTGTSMGVALTDWTSTDRLNDSTWSTIFVRYVGSSNPGTATDGILTVWISDKRLKDSVSGDFAQVFSSTTHTGGVVERFRLGTGCQSNTPAPVTNHYRLMVLGQWTTDFATSFAAIKAEAAQPFGGEVGCDVPSATAGKRDVRLYYRHNVDLWGTGGGTVTAGFQVATDSAFSSVVSTISATTIDATTHWVKLGTATGLDENTTYYMRAVVTLDSGGTPSTIYGQTCTFKTLSRVTPRTLRFAVGGCASAPLGEPNTSLQTMLAGHGSNALDEWWFVGDTWGYTDNRLYDRGKRGVVSTETILEDYWVTQGTPTAEKLNCSVRTIKGFDDHDMPFTTVNVTGIATGTGSVLITAAGHKASVGNIVRLESTNSTPAIDGKFEVVTVPTADTLTINATVTGAGTSGTMKQMGIEWAGLGDAAVNAEQYIEARDAWEYSMGHCRPATTSAYLGDAPSVTGPDGAAAADDDIFYWSTDTAKCRIVHLDTRIWRDYGAGTILHADVLSWLTDLIAGSTKPLLIIDSPVRFTDFNVNKVIQFTNASGVSTYYGDNWGSDGTRGDFQAQRDAVIAAIDANASIKHTIFVTHDDHMIDITRGHGLAGNGTDSSQTTDKLSVSSSMFSVANHDTEDLRDPTDGNYSNNPASTGTVGAWDEDAGGYELIHSEGDNTLGRGYVVITIDEAAETYSVQAIDGTDGSTIGDAVTGSFTSPNSIPASVIGVGVGLWL